MTSFSAVVSWMNCVFTSGSCSAPLARWCVVGVLAETADRRCLTSKTAAALSLSGVGWVSAGPYGQTPASGGHFVGCWWETHQLRLQREAAATSGARRLGLDARLRYGHGLLEPAGEHKNADALVWASADEQMEVSPITNVPHFAPLGDGFSHARHSSRFGPAPTPGGLIGAPSVVF